MTRTVYVIGIGAGDPEHLTLQAVAAMNRVDVFFTIDKGEATADLAALRAELLARHVTRPHRVVAAPEVPRDREPAAYVDTATQWQLRRGMLYEGMIAQAVVPAEWNGVIRWAKDLGVSHFSFANRIVGGSSTADSSRFTSPSPPRYRSA